jgi:hypothetical protein
MTLDDWSEIFIETILNVTSAPTSFAPIALRSLGFGSRAKQITDVIPRFSANLTVAASLLGGFVPSPDTDRRSRALIIRLPESPQILKWPLSTNFGAFVATADRLESLLRDGAQFTPQHFGIDRVFVEVDSKQIADNLAPPVNPANLFSRFPGVRGFVGRSAIISIVSDSHQSTAEGTGFVSISYTKDLDSAMELAGAKIKFGYP